jgi:hypothetical protein
MQAADLTNLNWITQPNEQITVSETHSPTMIGINFALDLHTEQPPTHTFTMGADGRRVFTVNANFSGLPDELCKTTVTGSAGGTGAKTIRQPPNSSFGQLHFTFTVGE